jgi:hypothetical protein
MKNNTSATQIENSRASRSDHPGYYWDAKDECFRKIDTDARIEGNPPVIEFADRRAMALGCEDKKFNNVNPEFRGIVVIECRPARVMRSGVFNGVLHFGILGKANGESFLGWVPAFLCQMPSEPEAARIAKNYQL